MLPEEVICVLGMLNADSLAALLCDIQYDVGLPATTNSAVDLVVWLKQRMLISLDKNDVGYLVERTKEIHPRCSDQLKELMSVKSIEPVNKLKRSLPHGRSEAKRTKTEHSTKVDMTPFYYIYSWNNKPTNTNSEC